MTERASTRAEAPLARHSRVRAGAVIVIALLAGFIVWLVVRDGGSSTTPQPPRASAVPVSAPGLKTLARAVDRLVFDAGRFASN